MPSQEWTVSKLNFVMAEEKRSEKYIFYSMRSCIPPGSPELEGVLAHTKGPIVTLLI